MPTLEELKAEREKREKAAATTALPAAGRGAGVRGEKAESPAPGSTAPKTAVTSKNEPAATPAKGSTTVKEPAGAGTAVRESAAVVGAKATGLPHSNKAPEPTKK